jgi:ribonuclease-3
VIDEDDRIAAVAAALGYDFRERSLLRDALTHSSFANERPRQAQTDNERLEFMGDAVLEWVVSTMLWEVFPGATAGEMTRRRADLVCESALANIASTLDIGPALRLGRGEERTGGRENPRLLACALEACVAAVYLDGGNEAAVLVCRRMFAGRFDEAPPGARDFKSRVQEQLQSTGLKPPRYELLQATGPDHAREFSIGLMVDGRELGRGTGRSKLEAEQAAAEQAWATLAAEAPPQEG